MKKLCIVLLGFCAAGAYAKTTPPLQSAKVLSQDISTSNNGAAVIPIGGMLAGVPLRETTNTVVVETGSQRLTWIENDRSARVGKHLLILPVNGTIQYYQDGAKFFVTDSAGKKHQFGLVHMESIPR